MTFWGMCVQPAAGRRPLIRRRGPIISAATGGLAGTRRVTGAEARIGLGWSSTDTAIRLEAVGHAASHRYESLPLQRAHRLPR